MPGMYLTLTLLAALFLLALWAGWCRMVRLEHLTRARLVNGFLAAMVLLTLMSAAHGLGWMDPDIAARITMGLYAAASGFFFGFGAALYRLREPAGPLLYVYRSPWTDLAPNLLSVALFAFGIYRTGLLAGDPFTGIGLTSGLSLVGLAFFGWTVRVVPEFRTEGLLLVDQFVAWKRILAWSWIGEETLQLDYMTDEEGHQRVPHPRAHGRPQETGTYTGREAARVPRGAPSADLGGGCLAQQAAMLNHQALVLYIVQSLLPGARHSLLGGDAQLGPYQGTLAGLLHAPADILHHLKSVGGVSKNIHHIHLRFIRNVVDRRIGLLPQHLPVVGMHRDDAVALFLQVGGDLVARAPGFAGAANDGDGFRLG
ncbi:MAG: hypothetical protein U5K31_13250 [Balneolaceae bacterium]|nr:hypothetical protein [Balneolaceae bacterium]